MKRPKGSGLCTSDFMCVEGHLNGGASVVLCSLGVQNTRRRPLASPMHCRKCGGSCIVFRTPEDSSAWFFIVKAAEFGTGLPTVSCTEPSELWVGTKLAAQKTSTADLQQIWWCRQVSSAFTGLGMSY